MDKLILRQLRRAGLAPDALPADLTAWQAFLDSVSRSYAQRRQDRYLLERSLEVSSREMQTLYDELRRASASQVAAERDKLAAIINGFRDGFCSLDADGRLAAMNPASEALLGDAESLLGQPVLERFGFSRRGDHAEPWAAAQVLARVCGGRSVRDDRAELRDAAGRTRPVSVLLYPIVQGGEVTGCALTFRDITRQLSAEAARRRLAKAVEASADAIYVTDREGRIEYVNPAFTGITGWQAEAATGARPSILASGRTPRQVYADLWRTITSGRIWSGRLLNRRRLGSEGFEHYWAQTTIAPLRGDDEALVGFVAVQRDVSGEVLEEHRRERETRMAMVRGRIAEVLQGAGGLEQRLAAALAALHEIDALCLSGDAMVLARGDGDSERVELRLGEPPAAAVGALQQGGCDDLQPLYLPALAGILLPIPQGGRWIGGAWLGVGAEPELGEAERGLLSLVAGMIGVALADEHARREAERARLAALEAVEAKSRFLANMSHEIRTPMNGVLGMLEMLSQTGLDGEQQDYVETALGSAEALLTVINDILDFSKIEAGKLDLERIPFDVRPLAEDVTTLFSSRNQSGALELACYVPIDLDTRVVGDPTRLRQVLNNLVGNAVKFTERGEVVVRVLPADEPQSGKAHLRFEVADTGIGMTGGQLARLFRPFEQADGSTTRRFGGTGLGLAISKQLIELMGGEIGADSVHGRGSTFWFTVPFDRQPGRYAVAEAGLLAGASVLAVDDNATNRAILGHYLHSWGVASESAADGLQALRLLREAAQAGRAFGIALLDVQMPQLDGLTLARLIKADPLIAATRLLVISSGGQADLDSASLGIEYVLSKPIRQSHLYDALLQLAQGDREDGTRAVAPAKQALRSALEAPLHGHVLLAEDNRVNQRVAVSMLERLGLSVEVVDDGRRAVEAAFAGAYDLILMDCQMPEMDGFEASAEIRRREAAEPDSRHVIVALTANAMAGDREKCIAAGMDEYIPKPIKLERLRRCLAQWLGDGAASSTAAAVEIGDPPTGLTVDTDAMDNLKDLLADGYVRFLDLYVAKTEELMKAMQDAVDRCDAGAVARAAHALKGSAGNLGAVELVELAQRLEQGGASGDLSGAERTLERAWTVHARVLDDVRRLRALEAPAAAD